MIPNEAVEAIARSFPGYTPEDVADDLERETNATCRVEAKRILEVAAPHMFLAIEDAIHNAGHEEWCDAYTSYAGTCRCWKADMLKMLSVEATP